MQSPQKTYGILIKRIRPYLDRLKKNNKYYYYYDALLSEVTNAINELNLSSGQQNSRLNEDFIFGYYAQKKQTYTKKMNQGEENNHDEV